MERSLWHESQLAYVRSTLVEFNFVVHLRFALAFPLMFNLICISLNLIFPRFDGNSGENILF